MLLPYFAGPLFSEAEKQFNQRLTDKIETLGYRVFLPQRDGVERGRPPYDAMPPNERRRIRFALDKDNVLACDVFLFVLDGRVPDEGACVELGIAYCQAVNGVSFAVAPGETLGIVGESGSAKLVTVLSVLGPMRAAGTVKKSSRALFSGTDFAQAEPAATGGHPQARHGRRLSGPDGESNSDQAASFIFGR